MGGKVIIATCRGTQESSTGSPSRFSSSTGGTDCRGAVQGPAAAGTLSSELHVFLDTAWICHGETNQ